MRTKKINKAKFLRSKITTLSKFSKTFKKVNVFVPKRWSLVILKSDKQQFYVFKLFSNVYYIKFSLPFIKTTLNYCPNTSVITISSYLLPILTSSWIKSINAMFYLFSSFIFNKLKFKGKGYYIYKNLRNTIAPQFGYYHRIYVYSYFNKVKFLSKTKVLLFGLTKEDILVSSYGIKGKRPVNIFTSRGVRFARQIIYKKTGKVSSYR